MADRDRDHDIVAKEFEAVYTLRKRYRMRDAGKGKYDACCPAHDDRNRSLRVYRADDGRLRFRCYAGCSFNDIRLALGLPVFGGRKRPEASYRPGGRTKADEPREKRYDFEALAGYFACDGPDVAPLAGQLGVSVASLLDADVGLADAYPMYVRHRKEDRPVTGWTFPMSDSHAECCGLRMRSLDGLAKYSFTDSTPGLFLGRRFDLKDHTLLIVEGPTDRAAAYDWGFNNVWGKPSCNDGDDLIEAMLRGLREVWRPELVVLAQVDSAKPRVKDRPEMGVFYPGQDGAVATADHVGWMCRGVKIITPPPGIKDARQWLHAGGTRADVDRMIRSKGFHRTTRRTA